MSFAPILVAFLLGSIPSAVIVGRLAGSDVRKQGSGNPGAANTWRVAGRVAGLVVLFLDGFKGWLAAGVLPALFTDAAPWVAPAAAASAVLGHVFTPWFRLRGGKGVATAAGAIGALAPRLLIAPLAFFVIAFAFRRRVSEASIVAALTLPVVAVAYRVLPPPGWPETELLVLSAALAVLVLWSHRANIRRIRAGREPRLGL
ncbi:MAG: glycerol-3-phosphate 1-O-acyltransferase [Acidobacteria bacterium]|nr:MAG: glycerol-3-phosphate 1-O-acyltransferase [Acidobacteriota bacterium]